MYDDPRCSNRDLQTEALRCLMLLDFEGCGDGSRARASRKGRMSPELWEVTAGAQWLGLGMLLRWLEVLPLASPVCSSDLYSSLVQRWQRGLGIPGGHELVYIRVPLIKV